MLQHRWFRLILSLFVLMIAAAVYLRYFYDFPERIDVKAPAVILNDTGELIESDTTLTINGTLKSPLAKNKYFEGVVEVAGSPTVAVCSLSR